MSCPVAGAALVVVLVVVLVDVLVDVFGVDVAVDRLASVKEPEEDEEVDVAPAPVATFGELRIGTAITTVTATVTKTSVTIAPRFSEATDFVNDHLSFVGIVPKIKYWEPKCNGSRVHQVTNLARIVSSHNTAVLTSESRSFVCRIIHSRFLANQKYRYVLCPNVPISHLANRDMNH
jgi:hypothetical protein